MPCTWLSISHRRSRPVFFNLRSAHKMGNTVQRAYDESDSSSEHELIDNAAPQPVDPNAEEEGTEI